MCSKCFPIGLICHWLNSVYWACALCDHQIPNQYAAKLASNLDIYWQNLSMIKNDFLEWCHCFMLDWEYISSFWKAPSLRGTLKDFNCVLASMKVKMAIENVRIRSVDRRFAKVVMPREACPSENHLTPPFEFDGKFMFKFLFVDSLDLELNFILNILATELSENSLKSLENIWSFWISQLR